MENWTEIKTAYLLGQLGTVSAAAEAVGVHRATIIRRVESLEKQLNGKLFQRHSKGYTPTELGLELIRIAEKSDKSFRSLIVKARTQDEDLAGKFVITCPEFLDHIAFFAVRIFKTVHPNVSVHFHPSEDALKLEYGDADVAITLGEPPDHPDYVVRPLANLPVGLFSSMDQHSPIRTDDIDVPKNVLRFVRCDKNVYGDAVEEWIDNNIAAEQVVLTSSSIRSAMDATISGLGAGFLPNYFAERVTWLSPVMPRCPEWAVPTWLVTHVDLHRSAKVQSFLKIVKTAPQFEAAHSKQSLMEPPSSEMNESGFGAHAH
ncbi:MAG: LysR family transcriptional regulator [Pseudomonadota bacterium]